MFRKSHPEQNTTKHLQRTQPDTIGSPPACIPDWGLIGGICARLKGVCAGGGAAGGGGGALSPVQKMAESSFSFERQNQLGHRGRGLRLG